MRRGLDAMIPCIMVWDAAPVAPADGRVRGHLGRHFGRTNPNGFGQTNPRGARDAANSRGRPMTHKRRIAVNPVLARRYAAVPPYCPVSVTIMHARLHALLLVGLLAGAPTYARADDAGSTSCRPA